MGVVGWDVAVELSLVVIIEMHMFATIVRVRTRG